MLPDSAEFMHEDVNFIGKGNGNYAVMPRFLHVPYVYVGAFNAR